MKDRDITYDGTVYRYILDTYEKVSSALEERVMGMIFKQRASGDASYDKQNMYDVLLVLDGRFYCRGDEWDRLDCFTKESIANYVEGWLDGVRDYKVWGE